MKIQDYTNFSIIDLLITQELNAFLAPIRRYSLFKRIKSLLSDNSTLSVSNFYKRLSDLEKQGFIKANLDKVGKIKTIEPTESTLSLNISIIKYLFLILIGNDLQKENITELGNVILKKIRTNYFDKLLYLFTTDFIFLVLETLHFISQITEDLNLLSQIRYSDYFSRSEMKKYKVKYTEMDKNRIREPDNIFDAVYIEIYKKQFELQGLNKNNLFKEILRVTKPKSPVILLGYMKKSSASVDIIDYILNAYPELISNDLFEEEELLDDMNNIGLENIEIIKHKGRFIGIGYVPE